MDRVSLHKVLGGSWDSSGYKRSSPSPVNGLGLISGADGITRRECRGRALNDGSRWLVIAGGVLIEHTAAGARGQLATLS